MLLWLLCWYKGFCHRTGSDLFLFSVFISQHIRYTRACSSNDCFILRARRLSSKLLKQGYLVERLNSSLREFYGRYADLIQQYEVSLSRMLNDILILDQQWLPNQSDFPPLSWPWNRAWPSPIMSGFHWTFAMGVARQQGTLTFPDTWLCPPPPIVGLVCAPVVETRFLELAMSLLDFSPRITLGTFSILPSSYSYLIRMYIYVFLSVTGRHIIGQWSHDSENVAKLAPNCRWMDCRWWTDAKQKYSNEMCISLTWIFRARRRPIWESPTE